MDEHFKSKKNENLQALYKIVQYAMCVCFFYVYLFQIHFNSKSLSLLLYSNCYCNTMRFRTPFIKTNMI